MPDRAVTRGAHHIGLTVPDLAKTRAFFIDTLGFAQVGEVPDYPAVFLSDGTTLITLWQAANPATAVPFDRKNVIGLHHLALKVEGADGLEALHDSAEGRRRRGGGVRAGAARRRADQAHDVRDPGRYPGRVHRGLTANRSNPRDMQDSRSE